MLVSASIGTLLVTALMDANVASSRMYKQIKEKSDKEWHIRLARTLIRNMSDNTDILKCIQELNTKVKIADGFSFAVRQDGTDFYIVVASNVDTEDRLGPTTSNNKDDDIYLKTTATPSPDYDSEAIQITSSLVSNVNTPECALTDEDYSPACYEVIGDKSDSKFGQHKIACEKDNVTYKHELVAFGLNAGKENTSSGYRNTFLGNLSGAKNTEGDNNTFLGNLSGAKNTEGDNNTFLGNLSGAKNTTGSSNTYVGYKSGLANTGNYNTFLGKEAGLNSRGSYSTYLGYQSGSIYNTNVNNPTIYNTGNSNTFLGYRAGSMNTTGWSNVFLGNKAGENNTEGSYNVLIGKSSNQSGKIGQHNVFIGYASGQTTEGQYNISIGDWASYKQKEGRNNIAIGSKAGCFASGQSTLFCTSSDSIFIGAKYTPTSSTDTSTTNKLNIGNIITGHVRSGNLLASEYPTSAGVKIRGDLEVEDILKVKDLKVSGSVEFTGLIDLQKTSCVNAKIKAGFLTMKQNGNADCGVGSFIRTQSDRSLKKNIKSLENELENLLALKPSMYYWKNKDLTPKKQFGLIAQDVETIYPNLVYKDEDTKKLSLNYMGFIAVIIQSIKELHKSFNQSIQQLHNSFSNSISNLRLQDKELKDDLELQNKELKDEIKTLRESIKEFKNHTHQ